MLSKTTDDKGRKWDPNVCKHAPLCTLNNKRGLMRQSIHTGYNL